jgi:hypothetical protein
VGQDQRRPVAMHLVMDLDPVAVDFRHCGCPCCLVLVLDCSAIKSQV